MMISCNAKITLDSMKRPESILSVITCLLILSYNLNAEVILVKPGQADKIFDKAFLQSIKSVQLYKQVVNILGAPGVKVAESSIKVPGEKYHWSGRNNSSFNIRVSSGKIIDTDVITPDGHILTLNDNGEVIDYGK